MQLETPLPDTYRAKHKRRENVKSLPDQIQTEKIEKITKKYNLYCKMEER